MTQTPGAAGGSCGGEHAGTWTWCPKGPFPTDWSLLLGPGRASARLPVLEYSASRVPGSQDAYKEHGPAGSPGLAVMVNNTDPLHQQDPDLYAALPSRPLVPLILHAAHQGFIYVGIGASAPGKLALHLSVAPPDTVCGVGEDAIIGPVTDLRGSDRDSRCCWTLACARSTEAQCMEGSHVVGLACGPPLGFMSLLRPPWGHCCKTQCPVASNCWHSPWGHTVLVLGFKAQAGIGKELSQPWDWSNSQPLALGQAGGWPPGGVADTTYCTVSLPSAFIGSKLTTQ